MKKNPFAISLIALGLSMLSLFVAWCNPKTDASPNLIATLGVICTVLIGWQILSLIDLRAYEKKLSDLESRLLESEKNLNDHEKKLNQNLNSMLSATKDKDRSLSAIYDHIANVFQYFMEIDEDNAPEYLYKEIQMHLTVLDLLLINGSLWEFQLELDQIEKYVSLKIGIYKNHKINLEKTANDLLDRLHTMSRSPHMCEYDEKKKILESTIQAVRQIPVRFQQG